MKRKNCRRIWVVEWRHALGADRWGPVDADYVAITKRAAFVLMRQAQQDSRDVRVSEYRAVSEPKAEGK